MQTMPLPEFTPTQWLLACIAAFCMGLSKSGFGGIGLVSILLMATILPARASTGVVLPMLIFADILAVWSFRRHAQWSHVWAPMLPAALGILIGFVLMPHIPDAAFRKLIGWIVLGMVLLQTWQRRNPERLQNVPHSAGFSWAMGGASGVATMLANAAGPIMTVYLLARRLPKMEFVGTAAVFFLMINLAKVPFSYALGLISPGSLGLNLLLFPLVGLGIFLGRKVLVLVPQRLFEILLLTFAAITAFKLILSR